MISDKRIATKFLLFLLFCVFVSGNYAKVRCIESEREALLSFKNGLIDKNSILSSWRSNDCCKWHGVECSNTTGHVITLKCEFCGLQGEVRSSLVDLHHLNHLDISENDFGGIPIPKFIGSMKQLQHLYLKSCNFSETIPSHLGNLTNLLSLDLSLNNFGSIPLQLGNLTNLNSLDLSGNDFGGIQIPGFIGSMKQLQYLSLRRSNFSGSIPPQLGNLTNLLSLDLSSNSLSCAFNLRSVLESLETLDLSGNQLNGSMPDMSVFPSLTELDLSGNNFTGSIPESIGQLSKLQSVYLSDNSLEGLVSESHFIKLNKLKTLYLSFNPSLILDIASDWIPPFQLSVISLARCNVGPYFPNWIRTQRDLSYLDLSGANITDEAPRWLWTVSSLLRSLSLSDNQISGTIPNLAFTSIWYLDLSYNRFSGPIPLFPADSIEIQLSGNMFSGPISSICKSRTFLHMYTLFLSNNQLAGEIPNCWGEMPLLYSLNLANNSFSGEIPRSLGGLSYLRGLQLHGNNLSGGFPYNLRLCQKMVFIDVGGNKLTGEIPRWIGQLYEMKILNLRGNKLNGNIPLEICNLTNIHVLDLSINNLSWIIPDCFNKFTILANQENMYYTSLYEFLFDPTLSRNADKQYEYSSFQWKGKESKYRENLSLLKLIDFSSNGLTGNIPKSFSTMRGLISLNLSRNSLTGHIIPDIGKMDMLDSLDLSHNQLSGHIPKSLAEIYTIGVLDLSNNHLSGKIPTSTQLQSFNASSYAGNDGLCGDPLEKCPEDRFRPSTTNPEENLNEKDGNIFSFMQEVGISMGFGFIIGFWGVIGSFILKKSWRIAFFNLFDAAKDWFYVRTALFVSKWR